jgi:3-hydroxyisobutyrate dehydrogenase/glyoxylate/succinic semialdehyde reductase
MGSRMAANILQDGHELVVFNRSPEKAAGLVAQGARLAATPEDLAGSCRLVFTMLATPEAVEAVATGPQGFLKALPGDSLWVDCSTVNPSFTRRMASQARKMGLRFLDAPVAGSLVPAERGELTFYVGGEEADLQQVRPLLALMGKTVVHVGGIGQGVAMKMVNNLLLGQAMVAFAEALRLGTTLGLAEATICQTLLPGPAAAPFLRGKEARILGRDFSPEFPLELMHKDLHLASLTAYEGQAALPALQIAKELYALAKQQGLGASDFSAVYRVLNPPASPAPKQGLE